MNGSDPAHEHKFVPMRPDGGPWKCAVLGCHAEYDIESEVIVEEKEK